MKIMTLFRLMLVLLCPLVQAGSMTCSEEEISAFQTGATGCEIGNTNNDKFNIGPNKELQVNLDKMFTFSDWEYQMKFDVDTDQFEIISTALNTHLFDYSGTSTSSTIKFSESLNEFFPGISDAMIVMKSGNGGTTQSNYLAYSLDIFIQEFAFNSAFFNPHNQNAKDISHWTFYTRTDDSTPPLEVPEPVHFYIFILSMLGIILHRFKENQKA